MIDGAEVVDGLSDGFSDGFNDTLGLNEVLGADEGCKVHRSSLANKSASLVALSQTAAELQQLMIEVMS